MSSVYEFQQELIGSYIELSSNVLLLFESIIALSQEVDVIWHRKWTVMTWLYALTRYSAVIDNILLLVPIEGILSCRAMQYMDAILQLIQFPCLALFSALRVYSLLEGRYLLAGLACLLNLVPFATNLFVDIKSTVVEDSEICTSLIALSDKDILLLSTIARIMVVIGDILVLAVTWSKTAPLYREARQLNMKAPLATILVCDGTIYFVILLILNVLEVARDNVPTLTDMNLLGALFSVLPSIIVCRFILNLRQIEPAGSSWASGNHSVSLRFVGNIGQSLKIASEQEGQDEDEFHIDRNTANAVLSPESDIETAVEAHGDTAGNRQAV